MTNTYIELNAQSNIPLNGAIQLNKDKEAARAYFLEHVNPNTRFFHSLKEKTDYLVENGFWARDTVEMYPFEDFKKLFQLAYSKKFRFPSFLGAYKFFTSYALSERVADEDGKNRVSYLERFEDRVVMTAVHLSGGDYQQARDLVEIIITGRFQPATPTFLNAGRAKGGEMVSCFLIRMEDNMESIGRTINSALQLSKRGGGVGILLTNLREAGAPIQEVPDTSSGIVPVMKIFEDSFSYANQLGQRQGAGAVYLNAHHPDIMTFFDTKRENADEKIRIKTLSLGVVIPDITFQLARDNDDMYLFSPYDVERVEGKPFSECSVTENYHKWVDDERITKTKIKARDFFRTISEVQFESGYPYVMFEDTVNRAHTMRHVGKVNMSNLCVTGDTEILTDTGYRKAIDLYNTQEDFNVIVDERARTMNLAAKGTKSVASTRMFKTAEAADVYRVTTLEGHEIKATEWHKFYVDRDGELVKIPLHELVPGDRLLVQGAENSTWGNCHEPDLAYVAGVLAADGTFTNNGAGVRIDLYGDKRQFADGIKSAIHRVLEGRDYLLQRQATLTPEFSERTTINPKLHLSSAPLAKHLASYGITRETKVAVPEFVKRGDRETQEAFINGVWQMDGCITGSEKVGNISLELGSIHHDFLRDMQKLLLGFGVYSRIYPGKKVGGLALMPDGKGGEDYYYQSRSWTLRAMDRSSREILHDLVVWREEAESYWRRRCAGIKSDRYYSTHRFRATVERIEFAGVEDVFDPTVDDGHSVIYNGIVTGQCSEILQVNTPSVYHDDLGYEVTGNDISCNLGSLNVKKMLDLSQDEFVDTVQVAVRALDQVSRMTSIDSVPSVRKGNEDSRAIGLGQMNLHGALAHHGLRYGSEEALRLWDRYMALVTWAAMLASTEIAREHGESALFEGSTYQTGDWFRNVPQAWLDDHEGDLTILGNLSAPDRRDWQHLALKVSQHGMANAYLQTIPPTGSISYINHSTSSIHPIVSKVEIRKEGRVGRVYYPAPHMRTDNLHLYEDAYEIGPEKIIDTYAVSQYWIDQGQSLTLFFKAEATTRDLDRARIYAWRKGIRTMYYARIRQLAMDGTQVAGTGVDECESCML